MALQCSETSPELEGTLAAGWAQEGRMPPKVAHRAPARPGPPLHLWGPSASLEVSEKLKPHFLGEKQRS